MGLFDSLKKKVADAVNVPQQQPQQQQPGRPAPEEEDAAPEQEEQAAYDLAGFNPNDEKSFFEAVLHMESEGEGGGTDESRARIMDRYRIRDRMHWQTVKESVYAALAQRFGSMDVVMQQEMNFRQGQVQRMMQARMQTQAAGGGFTPVEGVSLEAWAAFNASLVQGTNLDDLLRGAAVDRARWDRVCAEWNARMSRDTSGAIATVYGTAFQNASTGRFGAYAREANAARAANRDMTMPPPVTLEQFWEIMHEQACASKQGRSPVEALKAMGLTIVDWTDLGAYMGYHIGRTWGANHREYQAIFKKVEAKYAAKYPGVKADLDIAF